MTVGVVGTKRKLMEIGISEENAEEIGLDRIWEDVLRLTPSQISQCCRISKQRGVLIHQSIERAEDGGANIEARIGFGKSKSSMDRALQENRSNLDSLLKDGRIDIYQLLSDQHVMDKGDLGQPGVVVEYFKDDPRLAIDLAISLLAKKLGIPREVLLAYKIRFVSEHEVEFRGGNISSDNIAAVANAMAAADLIDPKDAAIISEFGPSFARTPNDELFTEGATVVWNGRRGPDKPQWLSEQFQWPKLLEDDAADIAKVSCCGMLKLSFPNEKRWVHEDWVSRLPNNYSDPAGHRGR
ncbi:uncharacterized protein METZ01_LOCUS219109 [marine metagenome]|uniref:Uncharacterized protein n=1 Tax=marine metagenome TaxID=408172 RepID=A0A382FUL2_9ZZZZ